MNLHHYYKYINEYVPMDIALIIQQYTIRERSLISLKKNISYLNQHQQKLYMLKAFRVFHYNWNTYIPQSKCLGVGCQTNMFPNRMCKKCKKNYSNLF